MATYTDLITSAASNTGANPAQLSTILNIENGSQQANPTNSVSRVQGFAQITQATWATWNPGVPYSTDVSDQIDTAARIVAGYDADYGGDTALVAAAYNGGPGVANTMQSLMSQGVSQSDALAQAVAQYYPNNPSKLTEMTNYIAQATSATNSSRTYGNPSTGGPNDDDAIAAVPVSGSLISPAQIGAVVQAINPPLYDSTGLNATPWFSDAAIIHNNAPTKRIPTPVTFKVSFSKTSSPMPIVIKLKASLQHFSKNMKHITNIEPTRTGILVNLWGMEADMITGSGSTGLFINELGMTDFLSVSSLTTDVRKALLQGLSTRAVFNSGNTVMVSSTGTGKLPNSKLITGEGLRIAAKDAFVELLSLFRVNGVGWYKGKGDNYLSLNQVGADAWSPVTGSTSYQLNARNNDVWTRGSVTMSFRNSTYYGFFKSLVWTMDAEKPFQWNFNFAFQVEKTVTNVYTPLNGQ